MKKKLIILALTASLLTSCSSAESKKDNKVEKDKTSIEMSSKEEKSSMKKEKNKAKEKEKQKSKEEKEHFTKDYAEHRKTLVKYGKFSEEFAKKQSDEKLRKLFDEAKKLSEKTGYWDVKDFVLDKLGKENKGQSKKYPDKTLEIVYNWKASKKGEYTDKFNDEREVMLEDGANSEVLNQIDDKEIEDAFKEAYKQDSSLLYYDYVQKALDILSKNHSDIYYQESQSQSQTEENADGSTASSSTGLKHSSDYYDDFRKQLVDQWGFYEDKVGEISNEDIDYAEDWGNAELKRTGYGDFGLILGKLEEMHPGSRKSYEQRKDEYIQKVEDASKNN